MVFEDATCYTILWMWRNPSSCLGKRGEKLFPVPEANPMYQDSGKS